MRLSATAVIVAFMLGLAGTAHAGGHDGNWSVLVITEKGDCDQAYRYAVNVSNGQVRYAGAEAVDVTGTVAPDGLVHVRIKLRDKGANGNGRLSATSGAGTWHGLGPNASCAGRWEAERR
jgi:hypothetical protein